MMLVRVVVMNRLHVSTHRNLNFPEACTLAACHAAVVPHVVVGRHAAVGLHVAVVHHEAAAFRVEVVRRDVGEGRHRPYVEVVLLEELHAVEHRVGVLLGEVHHVVGVLRVAVRHAVEDHLAEGRVVVAVRVEAVRHAEVAQHAGVVHHAVAVPQAEEHLAMVDLAIVEMQAEHQVAACRVVELQVAEHHVAEHQVAAEHQVLQVQVGEHQVGEGQDQAHQVDRVGVVRHVVVDRWAAGCQMVVLQEAADPDLAPAVQSMAYLLQKSII